MLNMIIFVFSCLVVLQIQPLVLSLENVTWVEYFVGRKHVRDEKRVCKENNTWERNCEEFEDGAKSLILGGYE